MGVSLGLKEGGVEIKDRHLQRQNCAFNQNNQRTTVSLWKWKLCRYGAMGFGAHTVTRVGMEESTCSSVPLQPQRGRFRSKESDGPLVKSSPELFTLLTFQWVCQTFLFVNGIQSFVLPQSHCLPCFAESWGI